MATVQEDWEQMSIDERRAIVQHVFDEARRAVGPVNLVGLPYCIDHKPEHTACPVARLLNNKTEGKGVADEPTS